MRRSVWASVVKKVRITSSYPGYEYVYFKGDHDADAYFTQECGEDWKDLPWARFFLRRSEEAQEVKDRRHRSTYVPIENAIEGGRLINYAVRNKNNYEYMVRTLVRKGITDVAEIHAELVRKHYKPEFGKIRALVNRYRKTARQGNPEKHLIRDLIWYYHNQDLPLRRIAAALASDGISVSHEYVRGVLQDGDNGREL